MYAPRVKAGVRGQLAKPPDLVLLAHGVGRRHAGRGLELAHLLGAAEPLGQQVNQRRVQVVDAGPQRGQLALSSGQIGLGHQCECERTTWPSDACTTTNPWPPSASWYASPEPRPMIAPILA